LSASSPDPLAWIDAELARLDAEDLRRRPVVRGGSQGPTIELDGRPLVNFGSNDYLGLAADPRLNEAAAQAARDEGWGAGASPLVCGRGRWQATLEARLAEFEGAEAALVFSSGFAANAGAVAALVGRDDCLFADELNHASLIDGCRLSRAAVHVYPHADMGRLAELLVTHTGFRRRMIVSDSLFSMDGDLAPLAELASLAEQHGAMLLIDEAHATGVFGARGRGVAEALGVEGQVHVRVGTLSKALGGVGGFVAGRRILIDWLTNCARTYVFSTAPPPAACAAAAAAIGIVQQEPERRERLLFRAAALRGRLAGAGWRLGPSASQIIPIVIGPSAAALALAARLREAGLFVPAIRPPTVPPDRACLRISLTAGHTDCMIDRLVEVLGRASSNEWA
jgi:8-amino-7-oxononanoate synthase